MDKMKEPNLKSPFILALVVAFLCLQACASSQVRVNFVGGQSGNQMGYTFTRFDGIERKSIHSDPGQTLFLDYDLKLEIGIIMIEVAGPDGEVIWEDDFVGFEAGSAKVTLEEGGFYQILVTGWDAKG